MPRRTSINYLKRDSESTVTFHKQRNGLFKTAAELSILTGAKIAVALECESGKVFAFGTPSADPIIDSFLSGNTPEDPIPNDEAQKAKIISLQNELIQLKNLKDVQDRRMWESMARSKEIQESSKVAKLIYGNIDDLSVEKLNELLRGLSRVYQEI
ncbi:agamous-like MADS-box protein AGL62 [Setaria italica]|uniref:agamous-like MADS-box protein AGL62 n=1 Tax=Setaria italica TaxID=4555 RepID=UPI000350B8F4|nr:agamous-like MADS-box protein AGL62 [Setaria italica]